MKASWIFYGMTRRKSGSGYPLNLLFLFSSQKDIAAIPHANRFANKLLHLSLVGLQGEEHWALADYTSITPKTNFKYLDAFCDSKGNLNNDFPHSGWDISFKEEKLPLLLILL